MRILGLDPGSRITGVGIVDVSGSTLSVVHYDAIKLGSAALHLRIALLNDVLGEKIAQYRPNVIAVEQVFMAKNAKSALTLGHARGAAIAIAVSKGLDFAEYSARQIKSAVAGSGAADKAQVGFMVGRILNIQSQIAEDASDALACAICHSLHARTNAKLASGRIVGGA